MDQNQPTGQRIRDILTELGEAITDLTAREEEPVRINPRLLTVEVECSRFSRQEN
ncbi:hypothetical protein [Pseudactinotalea sp. HY160]|uniref:hypothetical protein n=1 Tax=Pseudactinotalea sp. HY160 TaxID=2654490 RepID=UPI00188436B3|nr:hypothetical protein [Pseudactinotalea sp. HY160]